MKRGREGGRGQEGEIARVTGRGRVKTNRERVGDRVRGRTISM